MIEEKNEFRALSIDEAADRLWGAQQVLILFHVNPDGDATGSAFALRHTLEAIGKSAWCISASEVPERLLFAMSDTQKSSLHENIPEDFSPDLIVSVDTASPSQLGALYEIYKDKIALMIDHHAKGTAYADNYIVPGASSCGEVLCSIIDVLLERADISMPRRVC